MAVLCVATAHGADGAAQCGTCGVGGAGEGQRARGVLVLDAECGWYVDWISFLRFYHDDDDDDIYLYI